MQHTKITNGNLKLYALTTMQTKNQKRKYRTNPSPILRQSTIIKSKKVKRRVWEANDNDLIRLGARCT